MENNTDNLSFGRYLRAARKEKKTSIEWVSKETRIARDVLQKIEAEDHDQLPQEVFARGFIRAYAKAVGADMGDALKRYEVSLEFHRRTTRSEADLIQLSKKFWPRILMSLAALVSMVALMIFSSSILQNNMGHGEPAGAGDKHAVESVPHESPAHGVEGASGGSSNHTDKDSQEADAETSSSGGDAAITGDVLEEKPPASPGIDEQSGIDGAGDVREAATDTVAQDNKDIYELYFLAKEETWLKVIADEQEPKEYLLKPGYELMIKANTSYNILIGNAGGVAMKLNGKPVDVPGRSGQAVNMELP